MIEVNSRIVDDESISYEITRNTSDLAIGLGDIANQPVGRKIVEQLSAEIVSLSSLVFEQDLQKFPQTFWEKEFLVIQPYHDIDHRVLVNSPAKEVVTVPISIMTEKFEPIAATRVTLFVP